MEVLLGLIERQFHLVVRLPADGPGLNKPVHTGHLGLEVVAGEASGAELLLVHADERVVLAHAVTHLYVDMFNLTGKAGSDVDGLVSLKITGQGDDTLNLPRVERGECHKFLALGIVIGCRLFCSFFAAGQCNDSCKSV